MPDTRLQVTLREVQDGDLDEFFAQLRDPHAAALAGDTFEAPNERQAFDAHWRHLRRAEGVLVRTIEVVEDTVAKVAGHIRNHPGSEEHLVSFWIDRAYWGRGVTTSALGQFLDELGQRPVYARVPRHNEAAIVVLRRNGFLPVSEETGYSPERGRMVDEVVLRHG